MTAPLATPRVPAPLLVRALRGEPVERVPVWMLRQAGRYLPGYRAIRARTPFLDLCRSPDLALEVTLEPIGLFDVDAAIVFADILLTAAAMGAPVSFADGGPRIERPVRTRADADALRPADLAAVEPTIETVRRLRRALPAAKAVIGFSAAPFTLAAYLVEGGGDREFPSVRRLLHADRATLEHVVERCAASLAPYLRAQADAGADVLMLFDTWAGILGPADFRALAARAAADVVRALGADAPPVVLFPGLFSAPHLESAAATGAAALQVDFRTDLRDAYARVGRRVRLQGNLDPTALFAGPDAVTAAVERMLDDVPEGAPHVANLGHGILPGTPVESVRAFVEAVRARRAAGAAS